VTIRIAAETPWYELFSRGARDWLRHDEKVREAVRAMLRPAIILELPATTRLDSLAIDFVIRSAAEAATYDAEVALVATSQEHRLLLDVTRFSSVLPVFGSAAEAVAHLERELRPTLSDNFLDSPTSAA